MLYSDNSTIIIEGNRFHDNSALIWGGVLLSKSSTITIHRRKKFYDNNATDRGGVLESDSSIITIAGSNFTNNVSPIGAIIYATSIVDL